MAKSSRPAKTAKNKSTVRNSRTTVSGPAEPDASGAGDIVAEKAAGTQDVASAFPFNPNKAAEYDPDAALAPPEGASVKPADPIVGASTVSELNGSDKVGSGGPNIGQNPTVGPLDRVRVDSTDRVLTTNQGVPIADNQNSLKAGLRGPTLLEDFILREKITHFDHERIPERIVHARGSAAHGFFECTKAIPEFTRASLFGEVGKQTPVFVRFSTVLGERGSTDTARDVRGFAVKFYTDEGNWDLVGNNIPVFFIQDAMKFPDLVHAAKPEPHFAMPQAGSAHDTFWDFASLMPEITHMLMWAMSDRAIPRSYRTMQGFGVHTYRLVNAKGESHFVKFHWSPKAGTHSLVWDEAVKISGADSDFHRRDLWEAIEAGAYPGIRAGTADLHRRTGGGLHLRRARRHEDRARGARADRPGRPAGAEPESRQLLRRNRAGGVLRGARRARHRLLERSAARRSHSFVRRHADFTAGRSQLPRDSRSTRRSRRSTTTSVTACIVRRSIAAGSPTSPIPWAVAVRSRPARRASSRFRSLARTSDHKVRGKAERFADHYTQATLFWNSQTDVEKQHIINAFRFELSRVQTPAVRERMVSGLMNVATELAEGVAAGLGIREMPAPMPKVMTRDVTPEVSVSPALSLFARPGDGSIRTRRVAILVADGCDGDAARGPRRSADERRCGSALRVDDARFGAAGRPASAIEVDVSLEAAPAVLYDALVLPDGADAVKRTARRRSDARIHQGPVPPLQADSRRGRERAAARGLRNRRPRCPTDSRIPA